MASSASGKPPNENDSSSPTSNGSAACRKCVKALQDLVSGLHNNSKVGGDPPPLTLLKAIAGDQSNKLLIENSEDGVTMHFPVDTTRPSLLKRWTTFIGQDEDDIGLVVPPHTLATSAARAAGSDVSPPNTPLTIQLKCRKCSSTGPEGGARAFLMGPTPLSVVVCHNRVQSHPDELSEILTHELVHLFDVQSLMLDLQQCENLAYSEIRAAKAAECSNSWRQLQPYCVKQKAISATNNLFPSGGRKCVQKVFDRAFSDNRPFDQSKESS